MLLLRRASRFVGVADSVIHSFVASSRRRGVCGCSRARTKVYCLSRYGCAASSTPWLL